MMLMTKNRATLRTFSKALLKKAASGVLAIFLCSRTERTLRAQKRLWPCWTKFFEQLLTAGVKVIIKEIWLWQFILFNTPSKANTHNLSSPKRLPNTPLCDRGDCFVLYGHS